MKLTFCRSLENFSHFLSSPPLSATGESFDVTILARTMMMITISLLGNKKHDNDNNLLLSETFPLVRSYYFLLAEDLRSGPEIRQPDASFLLE